MMTFNKIEQLLYFSICFFSNFFIINYLRNVYLNTLRSVKMTSERRYFSVNIVKL